MEDSGSVAKLLWPTLMEIAQPARDKRRLDPAARGRLILDLCSRASLSVRDLSQLLDRTEAYVGDAIRPLVEERLLTFIYPEQPRHPRQRYVTAGSAAEASALSARSASFQAQYDADSDTDGPRESPASLVWAELERIAFPARDKRRLPPKVRDDLVVALCGRAPLSVRELAVLMNRSEAYVSDAIQPLVAAGRLSFMYPEQPRHPKQRYIAQWTEPPSEIVEDPAGSGEDARFQPESVSDHAAQAGAVMPNDEPEPIPHSTRSTRVETSRTTTPHSAQASADPSPEDNRNSILNSRTNPIIAGLVGLVLGILQPSGWLFYALAASLGLATMHIVTGSAQYQRYRDLDSSRGRATKFFIFKAVVALAEILILYFAIGAIFN